MAEENTLTSKISSTLCSIDEQVPFLNYMGLAFWMAWNTLAFSGSFWLHDTVDSSIAENLVLVHLAASVFVLVIFALLAKWTCNIVGQNWFTFTGSLVAALGALFVIVTRDGGTASTIIFNIGCVLTGAGTTVLFLRAAALYGTLPPRRALSMLASCSLFSCAVFFVIEGTPEVAHDACFIALPIISAAVFGIRNRNVEGEAEILASRVKTRKSFVAFLASIVLCSASFELLTRWSFIEVPAQNSLQNTAFSQIVEIVGCLIILAIVLLTKDRQKSYVKLYTFIVIIMTVFLLLTAALNIKSMVVSSIIGAINSMYTLVVWGMLAHVVYRSKGGALLIFGFGNAALSLGTLISAGILLLSHKMGVTDAIMQPILIVFGLMVLLDIIFVFNDQIVSSIIVPIEEERLTEDVFGSEAAHKPGPGQWKRDCVVIAEKYKLTARETEVFIGIAKGKTAQQIADEETLSIYTVRAHIRNIYSKMDAHSKNDITALVESERKLLH